MKKTLSLFLFFFCFIIANAQIDENAKALQLVAKNQQQIGLSNQDLNSVIVSNTYFDKVAQVTMVYLQQSYLGLPVCNQLQVLAFKNDVLVSKTGSRIISIEKKTFGNKGIPQINADIAVIAAVADRKLSTKRAPLVVASEKNGHLIMFDNMGISRENISAELMWVPSPDGNKVFLAWQVYIIPNTSSDYWMVRINAMDKSTVGFNNLTVSCNWDLPSKNKNGQPHQHIQNNKIENQKIEDLFFGNNGSQNSKLSPSLVNTASYKVIPYPAESPSHTGGAPAIRTNPWDSAPGMATTLKWHNNGTTDYSITRGNNVWAKEDRAGTNGAGNAATSTTTGDPLTFEFTPSFTVNPTQTTPVQNQQFNITNLFYWNNVIHDVMYQYGFDEVSGNFQTSNMGRGGAGNDHVLADAQDGSGTNNANFATPADGSSGRMQMYLWSGTPQKDGDVDNGIVCHEFAHGISNRLTGGPALAGCLSNDEQMGEGWSDYYGLMFTQNWATSNLNTGFNSPRGVGTYAVGQSATGAGIRSQKYCTNFSINNKKYAATIDAESHNRGEIWCATLWDMTWNIINQVGIISPSIYDANAAGGNVIAFKIVTEGMKLQPCSPGFIDARDAILQADQILYGGAHLCAIWEAFRRRGMGAFASQGSSASVTDQIPDFTIGSASLLLTQNVSEIPEGQNITYTNTITTGSCSGITNFLLTDTLPANVTYISGGTYNSATRVVSFPVTLAASTTQTYVFTVQVNTGAYYPTVSLFEDNVTGAAIPSTWNASSTTATNWSVSNARSFSPTSSYFSSNTDVQSDQSLTLTNSIILGATPPPLSFRHWFNCESTYDGGVIESSIDGGTTWVDMQPNILKGGYIATMDATTLLTGRKAWSGSSNGKFIKTKINLTPYANQNLKIRFRFTSDVGTSLEGWYVDDIAFKDQAVVEMQSNLFNSTNVRVVISDTVTVILPAANVCVSASINTQPTNSNVCAGGTATFTTVAAGTNLVYQWQLSTDGGTTWNNISGATSASLTINNVTIADQNNKYRVIVSNACPSSVTSAVANLVISTPASITSQPTSQTVCSGANTAFTVVAGGSNNSYQWQLSTDGGTTFTNISGANAATLSVNNVTGTMNNNIYHVVISSCNPTPAVSSNVTLIVNSQASITTQPTSVSACPGSNATFTAVCNGTSLTYQWQVSLDGGLNYSDIVGQTNSQLTVNNVSLLMNNYKYRLLVNSSACPTVITSSEVTLTISNNASISQQPADATVCNGSNAQFSVTATGSGLLYQWQLSTDGGTTFNNIAGATTATLSLTAVTASMEGYQYRVVVSSACSVVGVNSAISVLHVQANAQITTQPADVSTCENSTAVFTAAGTGNAISYQWQVSTNGGTTFTNIAGETNATLTLTNVAVSLNNNKYRLVVTSATCGTANSNAATLLVSSQASIATQPSSVSGCENSSASLSVSAAGTSVTYQWQVSTDGGTTYNNIVGEINATLNLSPLTLAMNNYKYKVIVSSRNCSSVTSAAVTLTVNGLPVVTITASPSSTVYAGQNVTLNAVSTPSGNVFSWYRNNTLITGQTTNSIIVDAANIGLYTATLTDGNGCKGTSNSVNVKDSILNYTFIYPNPNKGHFQIRYEGITYNQLARMVTMYDTKGARVYQKSYSVSTSYQPIDVDASYLAQGTYSVVLSDPSGNTLATGKVVIQ
jgi:uncharacterized repeat protein (TIGR01451 family)